MSTKRIINIADVAFAPFPGVIPDHAKERFEGATLAFLSPAIGAKKLGYNITKVPPGKRAFPFHSHRANEEMFFVLNGEGEIRMGAEIFPIRQGDVIACPAGGPDTAHQIINTSQRDLRYLAVSTNITPEIAEYPDSGKFGILTETFRFIGREDQSLDYWEGNT